MTEGLRRHLQHITRMQSVVDEHTRRRQAIGARPAMVGAVIPARLSDDPALSEEMLAQTRALIDETSAANANRASGFRPSPSRRQT